MLKSQLTITNYYELVTRQQPIAGIDEVGRGALCGPVVAAVMILKPESYGELIAAGVRDSKKLSQKEREALIPTILAVADSYHIAQATSTEIDRMGITRANHLAMTRAIEGLEVTPEIFLVDGKYAIPGVQIPQKCLIKGDDRAVSIAAASIVAKVHRDRLMCELAIEYPEYDFVNNKGYGTPKHRSALGEYGFIPEHRQSFIGGIDCRKRVAATDSPQPIKKRKQPQPGK
jgi:ribonuclease HII